MDQFLRDPDRNTLLFVHDIQVRSRDDIYQAIARSSAILKRDLKVLIVTDIKDRKDRSSSLPEGFDRIRVNTSSVRQLEKALLPYLDKLLAVVCTTEKSIPYLRNIIPHVPYLDAPTVESLEWATDKIMMRRRLRIFNKQTSPEYTIVEDMSPASIDKIKKVGFPLIVKPAGLAASVLVSVCYYEDELTAVLKKTFARLNSVYRERSGRGTPAILVEQFMEGRMYSVDIYVNSRGTMYATPLVYVLTAFAAGREDFYSYKAITPVTLKMHHQQKATVVAKEAVKALGLRSTTAHVELMQTDEGWKVIEVGPRVGGFRHDLLKLSFGIDHWLNDILIRLPMRPRIPRKVKGYSAAVKFYPDKEGIVKKINGLGKLRQLESYEKHRVEIQVGNVSRFARNGGVAVLYLILFNKKRSDLLADIRRAEKAIKIEVGPMRQKATPPLEIVTEITQEMLADK